MIRCSTCHDQPASAVRSHCITCTCTCTCSTNQHCKIVVRGQFYCMWYIHVHVLLRHRLNRLSGKFMYRTCILNRDTHTHMYTYTHTYSTVHVHTDTHTHTCTHTHTNTHTKEQELSSKRYVYMYMYVYIQ